MKNDYMQRYQFSQMQKSVQDRNGKCNAALYSRRKKHFIFDGINTVTALSFR